MTTKPSFVRLPAASVSRSQAQRGAQVKVGVTVSATGPAASLGIPEKNTIALCPKTIGGKTIEYILLDDATDTTTAVQNTKKLIGESKVDAIIGSTTTPNSLAMIDVFAEGETPTISLASSIRIIDPVDAKKAWSFKTPQTDVMMAGAILEHAAKNGVKTHRLHRLQRRARRSVLRRDRQGRRRRASIPMVANERFAPKDTSVTGQVLKLIAAKPDAIVIGASGTPAALPASALVEHGYKGKIYFNHGVANNDFLRVGGKDVEGALRAGESGDRRVAAARLASGEEARRGIHQALRSERMAPAASRPSVRTRGTRVSNSSTRFPSALKDGAARHRGISPRAARRARKQRRTSTSPTARST